MKSLHNEPHAEVGGRTLLERLFEVAVVLDQGMERGLAEQGLSRARAEVIWRLQHRGPLTQRELSEELRCSPRNVTGLVDALQSAGLVSRSAHPTDRRATLVDLTEDGRAAASAWTASYEALATRLFSDVPASDLAGFQATLDHVLDRLDEDA